MTTAIYQPLLSSSPIEWKWMTLTGPDAPDFLHRLTTVNVKGMGIGEGKEGCFLSPQGTIRCFFTLWNYGPLEYAFEFDAGSLTKWKTALVQFIEHYTFSEKIELCDTASSLECAWIFPTSDDLEKMQLTYLEPYRTIAIGDEIRVSHYGSQHFGRTWLTAWGKPARLSQWIGKYLPEAHKVSFPEIESWRIHSMHPRVDLEITEKVMPLEIGLKSAIAENKGCYPGQEVIEKIISIGSPPRRLVLIQGDGSPPQSGETLLNNAETPMEMGQITSVTSTNHQWTALGLVRKIHAQEGMPVQVSQGSAFIPSSPLQGKIIKIAPYV